MNLKKFKRKSLLGLLLVISKIRSTVAVDADECEPSYTSSTLTISSKCSTLDYYLVKEPSTLVTDYSTCSSDCNIMICNVNDGKTPCVSADISGYVLYKGGVLTCASSMCSKKNVIDKDYFINSGSKEPLIRCGSVTGADGSSTVVCDTVESADGYFKSANGELIKCEGKYCETIVTHADGYYINGDKNDTNRIIKCKSGDGCSIISSNTAGTDVVDNCVTTKEGMLLAATEPKYICTDGVGKEDFTGEKYGYYFITTGASAGYTPFGATQSVLIRIGRGSITKAETQNGFYINNNSIDKAISPVIMKNTSGTIPVAKEDTILKSNCDQALPGGVIKTSDGTAVKSFCPSSPGTAIDIQTMTTESYMVLKVQGGMPYAKTVDETVLLKYGNAAVSAVATPGTGYFLNSGPESSQFPMIHCVDGDCKAVNPIPGFYPNNGWNKERIPYFACNGKTCEGLDILNIPTTCGESGIGGIAHFGGFTYFCPSLDNKAKLDVGTVSETQYFLLNMSKNKKSPFLGENVSTIDQKILVKFKGGVITVVTEPTGYYLNAEINGDKDLYPVIQCWKGDCEKILENQFLGSCSEETVGNIIKVRSDYKFCKANGSLIEITTTNYYFITIDKEIYTPFTGPYKLEENNSKDILVFVSENAIELENSDGYYLNSEVLGGTTKLIKCHDNQCRPEDTAEGTYYMNNGRVDDKPIIFCENGGNDCKTYAGEDNHYYINSGDKNTMIYCEIAGNCDAIVPESGYYNIGDGETYKCEDGKGCLLMTGGKTCGNGDGGKLASTTDTICTGKGTDTFTFVSNKYKVVDIIYSKLFPFDITGVEKGTEIKILLKTTTTSIVYVKNPRNGYYISGANTLIKCDTSGCEDIASPSPSLGYYLNADDDAKENPFIYCNGIDACTVTSDTNEDVVTSCNSVGNIGKLLYDNGITKLCTNESGGSVSITTQITNDSNQTFNLLTVTTPTSGSVSNIFTGTVSHNGSGKKAVVKPGNNAAILMPSSSSTKDFCYKTSVNSKLIIDKDGNKDYEEINTTQYEYYANGGKDNTIIYCSTSTNCNVIEATKGYYIGGTETTLNSVIGCDGLKCVSAVPPDEDCSDEEVLAGNMRLATDDKKLCYTSSNSDIVDIAKEEGYYFVKVDQEKKSPLIGAVAAPPGGKSVLAKVGGNKAILVSTPGYYVNSGGTDEKNTLVEVSCEGENDCTVSKIDTSTDPGFYLDAADSGEYIKCDGTNECSKGEIAVGCTNPGDMIKEQNNIKICIKNASGSFVKIPIDTEEESYYLLEDISLNPITGDSMTSGTDKALIKVGNGVVINIATSTDTGVDGKRYLSSGVNKIIKCVTNVNGCRGVSIESGYYHVQNTKEEANGIIIYCKNNNCNEVTDPSNGYYYPSPVDVDKPVIEYDEGTIKETIGTQACGDAKAGELAIVEGNESYFCETADAGSQIDFSATGENYYIITNSAKTAFGSSGAKSLIKSGNGKALLVKNINVGYYISGTKNLIECRSPAAGQSSITGCKSIDFKAGYYLNSADTKDSIISCKANQCKEEIVTSESCVEAGAGGVFKEYVYDPINNEYKSTNFYYCPVNKNEEKVKFSISTNEEEKKQHYYLVLSDNKLGDSGSKVVLRKDDNAFIVQDSLGSGYYLDYRKNESKRLITCTSNSCSLKTNTGINYYISEIKMGTYKNLIKCNGNNCDISENVPGYYLNGDSGSKIIKCTGSADCAIVNDDYAENYTSDATCAQGKLLKGTSKFCPDTSGNVNLSDVGYYLITNPTNGPFGADGAANVLVKSGDNAVMTISTPGTGYYLNGASNASTYPIISCNNSSCTSINKSQIKEADCNDETKAQVGGLVSDSQNNFYVCEKSEASKKIKMEIITSETYHPIKLTTNGIIFGSKDDNILLKKSSHAVVLVEEEAPTYVNIENNTGSTETEYQLCEKDGNIFKYHIVSKKIDYTQSKACVKICPLESNSQCRPGYYLSEKGKKELILNNDDDGKEGDLYECTTTGCTKLTESSKIPIGYLINEGNIAEANHNVPYILCIKDNNDVKCKAEIVTKTSCTSIGDIAKITDGSKTSIKLCLGLIGEGADSGIELDEEDTVSYLVNIDTANIFGIDNLLSYMVINIHKGNAIIKKETTDNTSPKYRYTDNNYRVYEKNCTTDQLKSVCDNTKIVYEFEYSHDDENNIAYYVYNDSKTWS